MDEIIISRADDINPIHKNEHEGYEYNKREIVPIRKDGQCKISLYEIPPKKAAYPYHYHVKNEETFYILKGSGILRTANGERTVKAGDFVFLPANENGAHKLTNMSETENLLYIDFDTCNDIDIAFYPDSDKIGIWCKGINRLYNFRNTAKYYDGE